MTSGHHSEFMVCLLHISTDVENGGFIVLPECIYILLYDVNEDNFVRGNEACVCVGRGEEKCVSV